MKKNRNAKIEMVPIDRIHILNPRVRSKKIFLDIAENITKVGLKRPITITRAKSNSGKDYDLVCGQGRIEAFQSCGQTHIPAIIIQATEEETLIMSLVENLARKQHRSMDLLHGIELLQQRGYDAKEIAHKTGLGDTYTKSILDLLNRGEERLIAAVEAGQIPLTVAVAIADSPDDEQRALQDAYESKQLRGNRLKAAKKLLDVRKSRGKSIRNATPRRGGKAKPPTVTKHDVLKLLQQEADKKKLMTRKANATNGQMLFIVEALRRLLEEEHFRTLLKAEGLRTMPRQISELVEGKR
ncbi:MAG: chromosome partitioning protein ParB [Azospirillum brasilense]|nr:MAG: chromosome partitioning protein ParB [Azospirillum brasilense]